MTTEHIHRSKIGLEILIPIVFVVGTVTTIMIVNMVFVGLIVCGLMIALLTNVYLGTYYKITSHHHLVIKCGILEKFDIDIKDIERMDATREWLSSPALSLDRLAITYKGGRVVISPRDKRKFLDDVRRANPKL